MRPLGPAKYETSWLAILLPPLIGFAAAACAEPGAPPPPESKRVDVVDTIHGIAFDDPYRWLEDQSSPETRSWIDAQNAYAETIVGESPARDRFRRRLGELLRAPESTFPRRAGGYEYFTLRRVEDDLPILYRRPAAPEDAPKPIDPGDASGYEVVVDPHPWSADHTTRADILSASPDGALLLYSVRDGGQDEIEVRVRDVARGADLPDRLPNALYGGISFAGNGKGFYYTARSRETGPRVKFHLLGTPVDADRLVFGEGYPPTCFIEASEVADGTRLLITVNRGWARSEVHVKSLDRTDAPAHPLLKDLDARFDPQFHDGTLYLRTNLDAPNNRIVSIPLAAKSASEVTEILPERDDVLTDFAILDGKIYATYLHDVSARILVFPLHDAATPSGEIPVPAHTTAALRSAGPGKAFLTLASFTSPPATYLVDLASGSYDEKTPFQRREVPFDATGLVVEQVRYRSLDGTEVPMYLFHRDPLVPNGDTPTLLFGYGGFNVAMTPDFDPIAAAWVERGGIFAMANLRGGSEYGEKWHRAGMLQNKQNVFDDFIAAAEFLIQKGYTRPERLAIRGVSNGGLLVASALTQRPDLFRAVVCGFPDLDMVRFHTFTATNNLPALLEYGDASIPGEFEFLRKYSPYQAVRNGTAYPAVMVTSGDLDTRVPPLQARRMTASLQAATSSGYPVILRYHEKAGHAASYGMPVSRTVEDLAMELAFLSQQLGFP